MTPIEILARFYRLNPVVFQQSIASEMSELVGAVRRFGKRPSDFHLIGWKQGRGTFSSEVALHPKAGPAWLALARESLAKAGLK